MATPNNGNEDMFELPNILNLSVAEDLREIFIESVSTDSDLLINAENVETITTPCMQVLIAAGRTLEEKDHKLQIHSPSPAFIAAFNDLGFNEFIEKWSIK